MGDFSGHGLYMPSYIFSAVGALHVSLQARGRFGDFVFHGDNQIIMGHVFEHTAPTSKDGQDLMPGIFLARALLENLKRGHTVSHRWLPRAFNRSADALSKSALRFRKNCWIHEYDQWADLPVSYQEVFRTMGRNRKFLRNCVYTCSPAALRDAASA